ncbi:MAG TPA: hypothetical protein VMF58_01460 [Rhizomicrobium sp.]|nr:hypothetical protein [Rhizomicrobium sp.]
MSAPDGIDDERREMIRRLQDENQNIVSELSRLKMQHLANEASILRMQQGLPNENCCEPCWYDTGIESGMKPTQTPSHNPSKFDRWRCETCGHQIDRPWR